MARELERHVYPFAVRCQKVHFEHLGDVQDGDVELAVFVYVVEGAEYIQGVFLRRAAAASMVPR